MLGVLSFAAVMALLFWTLFTLATLPMDLIEATFAGLGSLVRGYVSPGPLRDLVTDGIVGGIAGSVVFLPQICLLFFFISLLEDTGFCDIEQASGTDRRGEFICTIGKKRCEGTV